MSHESDPKPLDPKRKPGEKPDDLPEIENIDDAAEGGVSFEMPPPEGRFESQTAGVAFADLADIPEFADLVSPPSPSTPEVPAESLSPLADDHMVDADELVPIADAIPSAGTGASSSHLARIDPPSGVKLDSSVKLAKLAGTDEATSVAEAVGESGVMSNLEPLNPVQPASGWFDSHGDGTLKAVEPPLAEPLSSTSGVVGGKPPAGAIESSDIFGGATSHLSPADSADVSDVIAATVRPPKTGSGNPADVPFGSNRPSDVALSFDGPPGGSTVTEQGAIEDLPEAVEMADDPWDVPQAEGLFDSAKLANAPNLPDAGDEEPDFGVTPDRGGDASSIMGELAGPDKTAYDDASGVRIEAPGISGTLRGEHPELNDYSSGIDLTASDEPLPKDGSNLFGSPTEPEIAPLSKSKGRSDSEADLSLPLTTSSDQSSIFAGNKPTKRGTGGISGGSGNVPVARPDVDGTDAVDFSDHPDLAGADSGSFHGNTAAVVHDDDEELTSTRPAKVKPIAAKAKDPSLEMDWVEQSSTEVKPVASGKPSRKRSRDEDDDRTSPTRAAAPIRTGRGLDRVLGVVLGMVVATGACAALYLTGTIPNGSKSEAGPTANVNKNPETGSIAAPAEITKLTADLKDANDKTLAAEKELSEQKDAVAKLNRDLKQQSATATKAESDLKLATDKVDKLEADIKDAKTTSATLTADLKKAKEDALTLDKEAKTEKAKAEALDKDLKAQQVLVTKLEKDVKDQKDLTAKTETDLKAKLKEMADTFAADTKKLKDGYEAEIKKVTSANGIDKVKEEHAVAMKKAADGFAEEKKKLLAANEVATAAELKKAADTHAANVKKLNDDHTADLKKAAEKFTEEKKAIQESNDKATKLLTDTHLKQVKDLENAIAVEKEKAVALTKKFEADLGNAVSPSQSLDQWLTILSGLRRPTDADPALAAANKVLATAPVGTDDHAKAQTVRGLAHLIKGEGEAAKSWFTQAKNTPAYKDAAGKAPWTKAADLGLASIEDPLAPLRRPVDKAVPDKAVAAKYLDAGITSFKSGQYKEAEKNLIQAAWNDDTNPLAFYFLGATRWQLKDTEQAKKDFADGGSREKTRTVSARTIDVAITPIQGPARDALAAARP